MKRFLVLLVVLAGGLAWAAFSVPSNAATVNGSAITQQDLNSAVSAIANSAYYQCYLNSEEYLSSQGSAQSPPVLGAGAGQYAGDHPTATTAFVASYLETDIGHQLLLQLADERNVTVTQSDLVTARSNLTGQISEVMSEILQTPQGENVRYSCSLTGQPLTGQQVLDSMPASFVDQQVQFVAEASALEEDLAGVGSSSTDLQSYFSAHSAQFDTACLSAAVFSSESAAQAGATQVAGGTPFATLAASTSASGGGALGCDVLSDLITKLPAEADLKNLATGVVSRAHQRQRDLRIAPDHLAYADGLQQGEDRGGERRPAGRRNGDPEAARLPRAPLLGEREPAVRGLGARERFGAHAADAEPIGRPQSIGQHPGRRSGCLGGAGCGGFRNR